MKSYRIKTTILNNGTLNIKELPFNEGDEVEVIVRKHEDSKEYPLRGTTVRLINPFESVAIEDWNDLK